MSDVTLSLAVGGVERVAQLGEYIAIKESNVAVDIHVQGVGTMKMQKGEVWRIKGGFDGFTIENYGNVAGTVLMAVGYGDYRAALSVGNLDTINTIVNPVTVNPHDVDNIVNPVTINTPKPLNLGSSFVLINDVTGALKTVVSPAQNTAGIIVSNIHAHPKNDVSVSAKTSAPVKIYDPLEISVFSTSAILLAWDQVSDLQSPVLIPAGFGLYVWSSTAIYINMNYEVL